MVLLQKCSKIFSIKIIYCLNFLSLIIVIFKPCSPEKKNPLFSAIIYFEGLNRNIDNFLSRKESDNCNKKKDQNNTIIINNTFFDKL